MGAHGAALSLLIFAESKKMKVIEIGMNDWYCPTYEILSNLTGLRFDNWGGKTEVKEITTDHFDEEYFQKIALDKKMKYLR